MTIARPFHDPLNPLTEQLAELERLLETTRQQYVDADHAARMWFAQCEGLRSANGRLEAEVRKLRLDETELLKQNADHERLIADLRQRLDWHTQNAERQADVIRAQEAEIERLQQLLTDVRSAWARDAARADNELASGQQDLPPTRAEEYDKLLEGHPTFRRANRIATDANEEREG